MTSYFIVKNAIGWTQLSFNLKIDVCEHNLQANEICQVGKTRRKGPGQIGPWEIPMNHWKKKSSLH
jgi:hypothetical protein